MSFMLLGILNSQASGGGGGTYDLLETTTLGSSASSVTFTGLGSYSDYAHLQIRMVSRGDKASNAADLLMQINADTGSNYAWHTLRADGSNVSPFARDTKTELDIGYVAGGNSTASSFSASVLDILDFSNSSKNTTIRTLNGVSNEWTYIRLTSGLWNNTNAVTSLQFFADAGNLVSGSRFSLFGRKGN